MTDHYHTAPKQCFSGGHIGHGTIAPMETPRLGIMARLRSIYRATRKTMDLFGRG